MILLHARAVVYRPHVSTLSQTTLPQGGSRCHSSAVLHYTRRPLASESQWRRTRDRVNPWQEVSPPSTKPRHEITQLTTFMRCACWEGVAGVNPGGEFCRGALQTTRAEKITFAKAHAADIQFLLTEATWCVSNPPSNQTWMRKDQFTMFL